VTPPPTWLYFPAPLWQPSDLGSLRAWYKADALSLSNNDPVGSWTDSSGGGYTLTASGGDRPTFKTSTLNGLPVVEFGGSNFIDASAASDWVFLHHGSAGNHVVAVWQAGTSSNPGGGAATQYGLLSTQSSLAGTNRGFSITYRNNQSSGVTDSVLHAMNNGANWVAINISGSSAHAGGAATILGALGDPENGTAADRSIMRVNGGAEIKDNTANASSSSSNPTAALRLGATGSTAPLTGYIAEVVICNAKLSDSDRQRVEGYLAWKWGLQGNLAAGHPYLNAAP
jgi:hypothetical protein